MPTPMRASKSPSAPKMIAECEESETMISGAVVGAGVGVDAVSMAVDGMRCVMSGDFALYRDSRYDREY